MSERSRGEWPTWVVAAGCGAAFVCGLFVSWAVFAEPANAGQAAAPPADQSVLRARIEVLEKAIDKLALDVEAKTSKKQPEFEATLLTTSLLKVVDAQGRMRISATALTGSPRIEISREDKTIALLLTEHENQPTVVLYDTLGQQRIDLTVQPTGNALVRLIDTKGKVRIGMLSTADNDAEFIRFDKFGNAKTFQ